MAYPTLAEEIEDLIILRLQPEDVPTRRRMVESALGIYARTSSVLALLDGRPVAFYHEASRKAFTLTGVPVELRACRLVSMPRIPTLDRKLERSGLAPPQHNSTPPTTSHSRYGGSSGGHYSSTADPGDNYYYTTEVRSPAGSSSSHGNHGSSSHNTHSHGSSSHSTRSHGYPSSAHYHTETRAPPSSSRGHTSGTSHSYVSGYTPSHTSGNTTGTRRPETSSGPSSGYNTETRTPDGHHHQSSSDRNPMDPPPNPRSGDRPYFTETRGPSSNSTYSSSSSGPGSSTSAGGGSHNSSSSTRSSPPPRPAPPSHPPSPPSNGTEADKMEWLLKTPFGFYDIMGVSRSATEAEIKRAYKLLAFKHHPDKHSAAGAAEKEQANRRFKAVGEANEWLSDAEKRELYHLRGGTVPE
ncbi:molecular chaperone [Diplodia corticola]|uniref:Molecular chaperone n=1 Tax=Diplodia corticola TaxID=236234 RepID=A0A1J9RKE5_9PEZI|nr:molecular chaperone [Diplodia corticola]OJD28991.1 molecular chaperone [Diplodia corticola]